ncbi:DUF2023 family protein [Methanosarcina acetivorans]|uniref:DUF2023 family protein n=1 Tax=Methanosarcina acetivorans TaxID=2214 RepID=UPI001D04A7B0|nr:DUF2023 family protein [Methanosarcina acetivorans]
MNKSTEKLLKRSLDGNMQVFMHHIYEFQKGLRDLILHTTHIRFLNDITATLQKKDIPYIIHPVGEKNINVFFGNEKCIRVINNIGNKKLSQYTDEEDFILGIMLGYDRLQQCERYIQRKNGSSKVEELIG